MQIKSSLRDVIPYSAGKSFPGKIKLSSNENPLGPSPKALEAIEKILTNLHRYPDGASMVLREKIASMLNLDPSWIATGNGSDEILALICGALVDTGDQAVISENTFSEYQFSMKLFGGSAIKVPLDKGVFDLQAMTEAVSDKTKLVFICNPNNPTGTYRSHREIEQFLNQLPGHVVTLMDEAYHDYVDAEDFPRAVELVQKYPNLLVTRTFSKIYGLAGLRIGYGFGQPELIRALLTAKQAFNVNLLSQAAGVAALDDKEFHDSSTEMNRQGKAFLYKKLDELNMDYYPTQTNFICIHLKQPADEVYQQILDRGMIIRSLTSFGMDHSIRYTISSREDNQKFISILTELREQNRC